MWVDEEDSVAEVRSLIEAIRPIAQRIGSGEIPSLKSDGLIEATTGRTGPSIPTAIPSLKRRPQ